SSLCTWLARVSAARRVVVGVAAGLSPPVSRVALGAPSAAGRSPGEAPPRILTREGVEGRSNVTFPDSLMRETSAVACTASLAGRQSSVKPPAAAKPAGGPETPRPRGETFASLR